MVQISTFCTMRPETFFGVPPDKRRAIQLHLQARRTMAEILEKLSEFGQKIEKKAPLRLTEEEKKIVEEIDQWKKGLFDFPLFWRQC